MKLRDHLQKSRRSTSSSKINILCYLIQSLLFNRKLVNNHTFFQHPDLIRVLRVHENVMAVMMNTLGRRAQAQSDAQPQATTGQEGEPITKEKVGVSKKFQTVIYFFTIHLLLEIILQFYHFTRIHRTKWSSLAADFCVISVELLDKIKRQCLITFHFYLKTVIFCYQDHRFVVVHL